MCASRGSSGRARPRRRVPLRAAVWWFLNARPAGRKADDAAEGGMENDMSAVL